MEMIYFSMNASFLVIGWTPDPEAYVLLIKSWNLPVVRAVTDNLILDRFDSIFLLSFLSLVVSLGL